MYASAAAFPPPSFTCALNVIGGSSRPGEPGSPPDVRFVGGDVHDNLSGRGGKGGLDVRSHSNFRQSAQAHTHRVSGATQIYPLLVFVFHVGTVLTKFCGRYFILGVQSLFVSLAAFVFPSPTLVAACWAVLVCTVITRVGCSHCV